MRYLVVLSSVLLGLPRPAHAECTPGLVSNALAARVDQSAIDVLTPPMQALIPSSFALPDLTETLMECGGLFEPTIINTKQGIVELDVHELSVALEPDTLVVTLRGGIAASAALDLQLCALPDTACDGTVAVDRVTLVTRVRPSVSSCVPRYDFELVEVQVDPAAVRATLEGCGYYDDVLAAVHDTVRDMLLDYAVQEIETLLQDLLVQHLPSLTTAIFAQRATVARLDLAVEPESIVIDEGAITLGFRGTGTPAEGVADCIPADAKLGVPPPSAAPIVLPDAMVAVGVSAPFAQRVVEAAWLAGWLCFDTRELDLDLEQWLEPILPGSSLGARLLAAQPPRLELAPAPGTDARLSVPLVRGDVELGLPNGESYTASAVANMALDAALRVDPGARSVVLSPRDAALDDLAITLGATTLGFSEESVSAFIANAVMPAFSEQLADLPIVTGIFAAAPVAVALDAVDIRRSMIAARLTLVAVDLDDRVAPETIVTDAPRCPCGPEVTLVAASTDDTTPDGMIRHQVIVDGVTEETIRAGHELRLAGLSSGTRLIELRAMDLAGNVDSTPVQLRLDVDAVPPEVRFVAPPVGIVDPAKVVLTVEARDDVSPTSLLGLRYVVGAVSRQNLPDTPITKGGILPGKPLTLRDLPDGATVRVTIIARDQAGNESEAQLTFAAVAEPAMGCTAVSTPGWLGLVSVLLLVRRCRRG